MAGVPSQSARQQRLNISDTAPGRSHSEWVYTLHSYGGYGLTGLALKAPARRRRIILIPTARGEGDGDA